MSKISRKRRSIFGVTNRYKLARYTCLLVFLIICLRLFQIQVINAPKYRAQAREQQWLGYKLQAKRGDIYTSDGYPIVTSKTEYTLYIDSLISSNANELYYHLKDMAEDIYEYDLELAVNSGKRKVKILDGITWEEKEKLQATNLKGVFFEENYSRYYPEETMLSHVLGFVGSDRLGEEVGYFGIEQYYDGDIRGQEGLLYREKTAAGDPILWGGVERIQPSDGSDIYLTIDRSVQFIVESKLEEGVKRHAAKSGTIIVVDPDSGAILAMASYPNFIPKDFSEYVEDDTIIRNSAISTLYEPGSVVKGITMASAIDAGIVTPESTYNDTGPRIFSGHKVDNWDGKHHGEETMIEILQHSNNLGAAWVAQQVGDEALINYFRSFGFGNVLGIDLEGEEKGIIFDEFPLRDIELANAGFGQGISLTPLHITMAFSTIANDGLLMKPYIVDHIDNNGDITNFEPQIVDRAISSDSSDTMVNMLTDAVSGGEAKYFVSKKYLIAGKTGTAQIPIKGGYDETRTNATFIGFFPSYRTFVMLVKLEQPIDPSGYAAETAVPLWMDIAESLAHYYQLPPDKPLSD